MSDRKFYEYVLIVIVLVATLFMGGIIKPAPEGLLVHQGAPTVWSMVTGPYEYIADESHALFKEVYADGRYESAGHAQYGSLILICTQGRPLEPVDGSAREIWCVAWEWDDTDWVVHDLYMWGTQNMYNTAKEAGFK